MDLAAGTEPPSRLGWTHQNVPAHGRRAARTGSRCPRSIRPRLNKPPPSASVPVSAETLHRSALEESLTIGLYLLLLLFSDRFRH